MKSVLIIDDQEDVRLVVKATLNEFGFATYEAADGESGIQTALKYLPDLIICDVNLGGMDGFGTLEAIRELSLFATTPFILMTGAVDNDDFRRGMACGADDYLQKPFKSQELIEAVVSRMVRHSQMQAEVEKRAEKMRNAAMQQISRELAAPINQLLGAASTMRSRSPSHDTEQIFANTCRINESVLRLSQSETTLH
jgi:DNA-binding response OmpR family regulator